MRLSEELFTRIVYCFVKQMGCSLPVNQLAFSACAVYIQSLNFVLHLPIDKSLRVGKQEE